LVEKTDQSGFGSAKVDQSGISIDKTDQSELSTDKTDQSGCSNPPPPKIERHPLLEGHPGKKFQET
jgi:hypothetical protein